MTHIKSKMHSDKRITFLIMLFFVLGAGIVGRLFYLQIIQGKYFDQLASMRHQKLEEFKPPRGEIFVKVENDAGETSLSPIATNQELYLLYAVPALIENATTTLDDIEKVLPMTDEERWENFLRLDKDDPYEPIRHSLLPQQKEALEKLNITGIGFQPETKRIYPQNNLFSHVLGFVGFNSQDERVGQYGLEGCFNDELAGEGQTLKFEKDAKGRVIVLDNDDIEVQPGADLVLTLDPTIQFKVCEILENWRVAMLAEDATAVVVEPETGDILAMCNKPDFDSNNYGQVEDANIYTNQATSVSYEPGSVIKAMTIAAALDLEKVTPATEYEDKGFIKIGPDTIRNAENKTYGVSNMTEVLDNSINTGAVFAALEVGRKNFKEYMENFGFGSHTNIDLTGESAGDISSLNNKSDIYTATASYGQGIMATPLQLTMAFGAIANQGILMQPRIVASKILPNGEVENFDPQEVRRVISSKTANILKAMLVSVVKNGHGKRAQVDGYYVAGKTGTANIAGPNGGYSQATNHTFIGFAPVDQPKFVILVKFGKPKNVPFSSDSAAPAFAEMAEFLLHYYKVAPNVVE